MTARDRDPQGVSDPAADLTRIEAIREACAKVAESETACLVTSGGCGWEPGKEIAAAIRALDLARLAPATPSGAATAGDAREESTARAARALDHADFWAARWKAQAARSVLLYKALRQFGQHPESCATNRQEWSSRSQHMENVDGPCDCGLEESFRAPASAERSGAAPSEAATAEHPVADADCREERTHGI